MKELLDYLKQKENENVYIIRALMNHMEGFKYEVEYSTDNQIVGLAAIWEDDKAVTLRGDHSFCINWFYRLYPQYNFFDMDESFVNNRLLAEDIKISEKNTLSHYFIMEYQTTMKTLQDRLIEYIKIDKKEWNRVARIFKQEYAIELSEFQPDNMEWICAYDKGKVISTICLERVNDEIAILSNFYTSPQMRCKGIGSRLLKTILNNDSIKRFVLFVHEENRRAIKLYQKCGFEIKSKVVNIETN